MTSTVHQNEQDIPQSQNIISILWPSFITGCLSTILFFAFFDPADLASIYGIENLDRMTGYSVGFFIFWALSFVSSTLTCYFRKPCNKC